MAASAAGPPPAPAPGEWVTYSNVFVCTRNTVVVGEIRVVSLCCSGPYAMSALRVFPSFASEQFTTFDACFALSVSHDHDAK